MGLNVNDALTASVIADQDTSDICNYFKGSHARVARRKFAESLSIATLIFDGRGEKKKHKSENIMRKEGQQEVSLLAATIAQECEGTAKAKLCF